LSPLLALRSLGARFATRSLLALRSALTTIALRPAFARRSAFARRTLVALLAHGASGADALRLDAGQARLALGTELAALATRATRAGRTTRATAARYTLRPALPGLAGKSRQPALERRKRQVDTARPLPVRQAAAKKAAAHRGEPGRVQVGLPLGLLAPILSVLGRFLRLGALTGLEQDRDGHDEHGEKAEIL
jgi:hypothetical protein